MSKHALAFCQSWKHSKIDFEMVGVPLVPAHCTLPGVGESFIFKQTWWEVLVQVTRLPFFFFFLLEDGPGGRHWRFCFVLVLIEVSKKGPGLLQLSVCFLFRLRLQEVSGSLKPGRIRGLWPFVHLFSGDVCSCGLSVWSWGEQTGTGRRRRSRTLQGALGHANGGVGISAFHSIWRETFNSLGLRRHKHATFFFFFWF